MDLLRYLLCRVPSGDKIFSGFQKGELPPLNWRCQIPFSRHNKMEWIKMDPIRVLLCRVPPGDKTFSGFQKSELPPVNWTCQIPFSRHNKMERIKMDPIRVLLRRISSRDKILKTLDLRLLEPNSVDFWRLWFFEVLLAKILFCLSYYIMLGLFQ